VKHPLPPVQQRPFVVVDRLKGMGLLLPSGQETMKAVVVALSRRYGNNFVVIEDELINTKKLRRMAGRDMTMPAEAQTQQDARLFMLEWAVKEAPYRVSIGYKAVNKGFQASAECRELGAKKPIHRLEGFGKTYDGAVEDLARQLKTFCGVLDAVFELRKKGLLKEAPPAPAPAPPSP